LIIPYVAAGKATKIFYKNMKVLLFEDEENKGSIFGNYNISKKIEGLYVKKNRLKTKYGKVQWLIF
jgi:hypothetical protein